MSGTVVNKTNKNSVLMEFTLGLGRQIVKMQTHE